LLDQRYFTRPLFDLLISNPASLTKSHRGARRDIFYGSRGATEPV